MSDGVAESQTTYNLRGRKGHDRGAVSVVEGDNSSEVEGELVFVNADSNLTQFGSEDSVDGLVVEENNMSKRDTESKDSGLGRSTESAMESFMQMFINEQRAAREAEAERRREDKRERDEYRTRMEEERKEKREQREEERRIREAADKEAAKLREKEDKRREDCMLEALKEIRPLPTPIAPVDEQCSTRVLESQTHIPHTDKNPSSY